MYLALAVHTSLDSTLPIGHPKPRKTKGSLQIWSVRASGEGDWEMESKLEMLLCSDEGGSAWQLEWCPVGGPDEVRSSEFKGVTAAEEGVCPVSWMVSCLGLVSSQRPTRTGGFAFLPCQIQPLYDARKVFRDQRGLSIVRQNFSPLYQSPLTQPLVL